MPIDNAIARGMPDLGAGVMPAYYDGIRNQRANALASQQIESSRATVNYNSITARTNQERLAMEQAKNNAMADAAEALSIAPTDVAAQRAFAAKHQLDPDRVVQNWGETQRQAAVVLNPQAAAKEMISPTKPEKPFLTVEDRIRIAQETAKAKMQFAPVQPDKAPVDMRTPEQKIQDKLGFEVQKRDALNAAALAKDIKTAQVQAPILEQKVTGFANKLNDPAFGGAVGWLDQYTGAVGAQHGTKEGVLGRTIEFEANSLILEAAKTMKGALSDKDVKFLKESQPARGDGAEVWYKWFNETFVPKINAAREAAQLPPLDISAGSQGSSGTAGSTGEQTATGPNGEKIVLRNGQWVPMQ